MSACASVLTVPGATSVLWQVTLGAVLGQGAFGTTYRGRWRGAEVAVKCVRVSQSSELTTFLREAEAMSLVRAHPGSRLQRPRPRSLWPPLRPTLLRPLDCSPAQVRHPNVVPFLGACLCPPDRFWLLTEFMPGGTMATWLKPKGGAGGACPRTLAERAQAGLQVGRSSAGAGC